MECVQHRLAPKSLYAPFARKLCFSSLLEHGNGYTQAADL